MSLPRALLASLCLVVLALAGCSKSGGNNGGNGQIRLFNAFLEASALNVVVGSTTIAPAAPFERLTPYVSVPNGVQTFNVTVVGAQSPLVNSSLSIGGDANYTYIVFGPTTAVRTVFAVDSVSDPGSGFYAVRVINTAAGVGPVDVYLTPPGADLTVAAPAVSNVAYGAVSSYLSVAIGANFEIRMTPTGTKNIIFDSTPRLFAEHSGSTIVIYSKGSGTLVNAALLNDNGSGNGVIVDNLVAQYKVINASLVAAPLNVFVDGSLQLSNIPFAGVSNYQQTATGAHTITVEAQATPGATLLTLNPTLSAASDTSIALVGPAGSLNGVVLADDNLPPAVGSAGVRFVNASASTPSVDVFVNFSKQVSALTQNTASTYLNLTATAVTGTAYEFDFNVTGTTTALLKLTGVVIASPHKYTVYLAGPPGSLTGIVTQDN
ncbi:MAG: DUF4397 domain-containing protein [Casimicrobiaceae bacterium]